MRGSPRRIRWRTSISRSRPQRGPAVSIPKAGGRAGNSSLEKVVKTTVYLVDIKDYGTMNEIYGQYFSEHKPARAAFAVAHLPKDALIEIEVVAEVDK